MSATKRAIRQGGVRQGGFRQDGIRLGWARLGPIWVAGLMALWGLAMIAPAALPH